MHAYEITKCILSFKGNYLTDLNQLRDFLSLHYRLEKIIDRKQLKKYKLVENRPSPKFFFDAFNSLYRFLLSKKVTAPYALWLGDFVPVSHSLGSLSRAIVELETHKVVLSQKMKTEVCILSEKITAKAVQAFQDNLRKIDSR